jgi:ferredoxin-NADP reductase
MAADVVEIIDETQDVKTYVLRPSVHWKGFVPGQYIAIEVDIKGVRVQRNYSISSAGSLFEREGLISITVKCVEGGIVSNYLADALRLNKVLHISEARGTFVLASDELDQKNSQKPKTKAGATRAPLFVAAGSGITPIMAMIEALDASNALGNATLVYAVNAEQELIFAERLHVLQERNPGFKLLPHYSNSRSGQLNNKRLLNYCPDLAERAIYTCGPAGFMGMVKGLATALGMPESAVRSESFGLPKAKNIADRLFKTRETLVSGDSGKASNANSARVTLVKAETTLVAKGDKTLLELAEQAGLKPKFGCRMGVCHEFGKAALAAIFASSALLAACDANDGPVEDAGEKVDEAVESITPDSKGPMEEMGEDMDNAYDNAKESAEDMKDAAEQ